MTEWEKQVTKALTDSEYHFLSEYDEWLRTAFSHIPVGGDEHVIHTFAVAAHQRLSSILAKHSTMAFSMGQAHGQADCQETLTRYQKKLADLPSINFKTGKDFTPADAIAVLQGRAITLAGDVENSIVAKIKTTLLQHLTGTSRRDTEQEIADVLKANMDRASLIVTTETTYAYNRGRLVSYRQYGADYVMFRAVMDGRTCGICASRDGKVSTTDDVGGNTPPVHGRCRCVLSPVFGELQPDILTPDRLDWSSVTPLPKGWAA